MSDIWHALGTAALFSLLGTAGLLLIVWVLAQWRGK
jgi:hypothetical protein